MRMPKSRPFTNLGHKRTSQKVLFQSGPFRIVRGKLGAYQVLKSFRAADQVLTFRPYPPDNTRFFFTLDAAKRYIEDQQ